MPHGNGALGEFLKRFPIEHIGKKPQILVHGKYTVVIDDDAAALLSPMLKGKKPIVAKTCQILYGWRINAEYAAFFM